MSASASPAVCAPSSMSAAGMARQQAIQRLVEKQNEEQRIQQKRESVRQKHMPSATPSQSSKSNASTTFQGATSTKITASTSTSTVTSTSKKETALPSVFVNTMLTPRGYALLKSDATEQELQRVRNALTVRPYLPGVPNPAAVPTYPVYRESKTRLYVPRYFGVQHWGEPKQYALNPGVPISLQFNGTLLERQHEPIRAYIEQVGEGGGGLLELYCGFGKTACAMYLIAKLAVKTCIIVHKEFLANQWVERIAQFLPGARVGRIQGKVFDIEHKDIVICMLQSLSQKEYDIADFASFGLLVVDEVHHISSEVFSNALFKMATRYMLGLSATMERKDGTSFVFKMFLGKVACTVKRDGKDDGVIVRAIHYSAPNDAAFNAMEMDVRGNVSLAKMMGKLCTYARRSEFILRVLEDMVRENPRQQIMLLASYRNILEYLHDAIAHRGFATVGYYVGGMKEAMLKETESKQIVVATYAMASEALDIPSLTTLILATPMTNIEQSVGRILRRKHDFPPIVVDIVDSHDNFKAQWAKRRRFYKKNCYKILSISSTQYTTNLAEWKLVYSPLAAEMEPNTNTCTINTDALTASVAGCGAGALDDSDDDADDADMCDDADDTEAMGEIEEVAGLVGDAGAEGVTTAATSTSSRSSHSFKNARHKSNKSFSSSTSASKAGPPGVLKIPIHMLQKNAPDVASK